MSEKPRKMILIKDGIDLDIFDDKNMSDRVLMLNYPEGTVIEQLHKFYKLIGKECENVEIVHPKRLYTLTEEQYPVMMLVDEEYLYHKTAQINPIASYLYETDVHGHPINGNVLIIGMKKGLDGMEFCGISAERAEELRERLITIRQHYTYRASLIRVDNNCAIGDIVDKLGRYEDICDDPERLKEMVKEKSIPEQ